MNILIILLLAISAISFNLQTQQSIAYLVEYITPFDTPVNDLKQAILNQLSRNDFLTNSFTTDHVKVSNLTYKSTHNTSKIIIDPKQESYKHVVSNDGIDLMIGYQAVVNHNLVDHKQYKCETYVKIYINYTKEIDQDGTTDISKLSVQVDKSSFKMNYSGSPSANDKKKLDQINNGVVAGKSNTTILMLLETQQFTQQLILKYFQQNLKSQKISPTYQPSYNYTYQNLNILFDLSTVSIKPIERGISHFMKGSIKNYNNLLQTKANKPIQQYREYHTLITVGFLNNFVKYCAEQYKSWQNIYINQQRYPNALFKYKLIDLEDIISNVVSRYSKFYLNQFDIICKVDHFDKVNIDQNNDNLFVNIQWKCKALLLGPTPSPVIMDFNIAIKYIIEIILNQDSLQVMINNCKMQVLQLNQVQDFEVLSLQMIEIYIKQILAKFRTYTIGSNFKIRKSSTKIFYKENQGIYIG